MGPHSGPQSPMGMVLQGGPQLSHDPSRPMLPSPNHMGMPGMTSAIMGGGGGPPDGIGPCNVSPMHPQNQMGGFPRMQRPLHSPIGGMGQQYPQRPEEVLPPQTDAPSKQRDVSPAASSPTRLFSIHAHG